jgi:pimeloyl-ACP methyl ester carboxylesterase
MEIPIFELELDIDGELVRPEQETRLGHALAWPPPNVIVLAHGWNSDMAQARQFYRNFLDMLEKTDPQAAEGAIAVGVLWPSEKFADPELIPGGAASLRDRQRELLNLTTYYRMKERAEEVGSRLNILLWVLKEENPPTHLHLVGHSFGARLVTAAVDGNCLLRARSLTLLQGAFSHNSFAPDLGPGKRGSFSEILGYKKVNGPILITHSRNDRALGAAYPIASRLSRTDASRLGDLHDRFGALGANGAQRVAANCIHVGDRCQFKPGEIYNVNCDAVIRGHADVVHPEIAALLAAAIRQAAD